MDDHISRDCVNGTGHIVIICWLKYTHIWKAVLPTYLISTHLLQLHSLWLFSLTVVNSQQTGKCTGLPGMSAAHETSATDRICSHNTLAHPQLHHRLLDLCPLGSHLILSTSLLDGYLTPQCS